MKFSFSFLFSLSFSVEKVQRSKILKYKTVFLSSILRTFQAADINLKQSGSKHVDIVILQYLASVFESLVDVQWSKNKLVVWLMKQHFRFLVLDRFISRHLSACWVWQECYSRNVCQNDVIDQLEKFWSHIITV